MKKGKIAEGFDSGETAKWSSLSQMVLEVHLVFDSLKVEREDSTGKRLTLLERAQIVERSVELLSLTTTDPIKVYRPDLPEEPKAPPIRVHNFEGPLTVGGRKSNPKPVLGGRHKVNLSVGTIELTGTADDTGTKG